VAEVRLIDVPNESLLEGSKLERSAGAFARWDGQLLDEGDNAVGAVPYSPIAGS
jgi:hypothetical protein